MSQYEIEIKSLLGSPERASSLRERIASKGGVLKRKNNQLNHYFVLKDVNEFKEKLSLYLKDEYQIKFNKILEEGSDFSVRTRDTNGEVLLVVKASIGDDSSSNGVSRMEFEAQMPMKLEKLDQLLLEAGLEYQAKWSREREEYELGDVNICLDKNAGYGYVAEFERVIEDRLAAGNIRRELLDIMKEFEAEELPQDRLERMFGYYNQHWVDYYGTDKIFNIK